MTQSLVYFHVIILTICLFGAHGREIIELNHDLSANSRVWPSPGSPPFQLTPLYEGFTKDGYWYSSFKFCTAEHAGTHLDAPSHFYEHGWTVDEIPVDRLIAPAVVIDIRSRVETNFLFELSAKDVVDWVNTHGLFANNSIVLVHTGWSSRYDEKVRYFGHPTNSKRFAFPGVSVGAVQTLLGYRRSAGIHIIGIGIDTPSIDFGPSQKFVTHQELAKNNIYIIENLMNLDKLPPKGTELLVMPLKIKGGSGSPARVLALLNGSLLSSGSSKILNSSNYYFHVVFLSILFWNL